MGKLILVDFKGREELYEAPILSNEWDEWINQHLEDLFERFPTDYRSDILKIVREKLGFRQKIRVFLYAAPICGGKSRIHITDVWDVITFVKERIESI